MKTEKQPETKIKKPIKMTVEDLEICLAQFAHKLNSYLSKYADNVSPETNIKQLEASVSYAYNIATAGEDLIKQLKNQK